MGSLSAILRLLRAGIFRPGFFCDSELAVRGAERFTQSKRGSDSVKILVSQL
jgi:hypothetical protein